MAFFLSLARPFAAPSGDTRADSFVHRVNEQGIVSPARKNPVVMPSIKITGALTRACILAGYSDQSLTVGKASARIGQITLGALSASSVVAGVSNPGFPYFGDANDHTVAVVVPPAIASIKIVGSATGSADPNERFGLVATSFRKITLAGQSVPQSSTGFIQSIGDAVGGVKNLFIHCLRKRRPVSRSIARVVRPCDPVVCVVERAQ